MASRVDPNRIQRIDRFRVSRLIASGGQAWVFEVEDPALFDKRFALKLLKPGASEERFARETRLHALTAHPNLMHVLMHGEDAGTGCPFYTMDLMSLGTLEDIRGVDPEATLVDSRIADVSQVCGYLAGALRGLESLHASGVVHRDVKPENIFIAAGGTARLGDLGIAKGNDDPGMTDEGYAPGTVLYMAPEQMRGQIATPKTDVFSMGLVLYRALTGRTVYEVASGVDARSGNEIVAYLLKLHRERVEFRLEFPKTVPRSLRAVVRKACRIRSEDRYASADEMRQAVEGSILALEREGRPAWLLPAVALALFVALTGVGQRFFSIWIEVGHLNDRLDTVVRLGAFADDLVQAVFEATGTPEPKRIVRDMQVANEASRQARAFIDEWRIDFAGEAIESARNSYERVCASLSESHLPERLAATVRDASSAGSLIRTGTQARYPGRWSEVEAGLVRLAAPPLPGGCNEAAQQLAHLRDAERTLSLIEAVRSGLDEEASAALLAARDRRRSASKLDSSFAAARAMLARGDEQLRLSRASLASARKSGDSVDFEASIGSAKAATVAFGIAFDAAQAFEARLNAHELADRLSIEGISVGPSTRWLKSASLAFSNKAWQTSSAGYRTVSGQLESVLRDAAPSIRARAEAKRARSSAVLAGAGPELVARGDQKLESSLVRMREREFSEAIVGFREAVGLYAARRPPPGPRQAVINHLEEYRETFQQQNMRGLQLLVVLGETERDGLSLQWEDCKNMRTELLYSSDSIRMHGDRSAEVRFTQIDTGCDLFAEYRRTYDAKIMKKAAGDWRMTLTRVN